MPRIGSHFRKRALIPKKCDVCSSRFMAFDVKTLICKVCKTKRHPCACGCGGLVLGLDKKYIQFHAAGHKGNLQVAKGHRRQGRELRGDNNPSRRPDVRRKLRLGVRRSWKKPIVRHRHAVTRRESGVVPHWKKYPYGPSVFRSSWELAFARWCRKRRLHYRYEFKCFLIGGRYTYTPDFYLLDHGLFIEIKGPTVWQTNLWKAAVLVREKGLQICILKRNHLQSLGVLP